ncbi:hypothetical protein HNQ70_001254 [Quisquiliibacterium transsilvanicum]|uniref:Uncharacterized protein n=1 Tax=Quisquiliibacterium transsilvanicum TaxID=1549638 RepID=A0A7W8HFW8_9BURK|nr:hypothetical protein [Quisquiliibacterium transsilvanicum]
MTNDTTNKVVKRFDTTDEATSGDMLGAAP